MKAATLKKTTIFKTKTIGYIKKINGLKKHIKAKYKGNQLKKALTCFNDVDSLKIQIGNKKIGKDTIIFNLGTAINCPSALKGLCDMADKTLGGNGKCYALKAERMYSTSYTFRMIQNIQWDTFNAKKIAQSFINTIERKKTPIKFIRLNESGDFKSFSDIKKLKEIALIIKAKFPNIKIYTYTHRKDLRTKFLILPSNVTINGSNFMVHNQYKVDSSVKKIDKPLMAKSQMMCLDDCSTCNLCKVNHGQTITQSIH